jgi:antitoxin MazE
MFSDGEEAKTMIAKTVKWGNSLALRIPKPIARESGIEENTPVDISYRGNVIVITPVKTGYRLVDLLAKVSSKNLHHEVEMSLPVGRELL